MTIPVIDENPNAVKKGLRMKVEMVNIDDRGCIESIVLQYSQRHTRGWLRIDAGNRECLRGAIEIGK